MRDTDHLRERLARDNATSQRLIDALNERNAVSLHAMSDETIAKLPIDQLENAVTNLFIASLQACDWEPSRKYNGHQYMRHVRTGREVAFLVVPMYGDDE